MTELKVVTARDVILLYAKCFDEVWRVNENDTIYGLYKDDELVAMTCVGQPPYPFAPGSRYLYNFCVDPDLRKSGHATRLLQLLREKFDVCTHVNQDWHIDWLKRSGFSVTGKWRGFTEVVAGPNKVNMYNADQRVLYMN